MPPDTIAEDEALACLLYSVFWQAIGSDRWQWDELAPVEKTAWIIVAQTKIGVMNMEDEKFVTLAKGAYNAYGSVTDHKNYQGLPMPEWDDLTDKIRAAWVASVKYCYNDITNQKAPDAMQDPDHK